jgi:hypothetical protein
MFKSPAGKRCSGPQFIRGRLALRSSLGLVMLLGIPVAGQQPPYSQFPPTNRGNQGYPDSQSPFQDGNSPDKRRIQLLNAQRQKDLISDTEKLLKLAKELNEEVAANASDSLSDAEVRKVSEIGKLAKSVKEKMSFSVGGYPALNSPLTIPPGVQ